MYADYLASPPNFVHLSLLAAPLKGSAQDAYIVPGPRIAVPGFGAGIPLGAFRFFCMGIYQIPSSAGIVRS